MIEIRTTDDGFAFVRTIRAPFAGHDPLDTDDLSGIVVRWPELVRLEAIEPWPSIRVTWKHRHAKDGAEFHPPVARAERFAEKVEGLFAHVARHEPHRIVRGWLDVDDVAWREVESLPETGEPAGSGGGPYRAASAPIREKVVARRYASGALREIVRGMFRPAWREVAGEVVITTEHVYVRRQNGRCLRLDMSHLRLGRRLPDPSDGIVYVFARRAELHVPHLDGCGVTRLLNQRLLEAGAVSG